MERERERERERENKRERMVREIARCSIFIIRHSAVAQTQTS